MKQIFRILRARAVMALIFALASAVAACTAVGPRLEGTPAHHRALGFANPSGAGGASSIDFLLDRTRLAFFPVEHVPVAALPPEEATTRWQETGQRDALQWLGHASLRLRMAGEIILVDPVLSDVLSPVPPFGPARASAPPIDVDALMGADAILVTHNHYDHYEPDTVEAAAAPHTQCLMPLGVQDGEEVDCAVIELDWHESRMIGPVKATLMPAQHDSARGLLDRDKSLWGGWLLEEGDARVYISGDTGYGPHFKDARQRGAIDLAVLNVGGYEPRRLNKNVHMTPEETVQAVLDLGARRALIVHWGTYGLGLESGRDTYDRTRAAATAAGLRDGTILFLQIGDVMRL